MGAAGERPCGVPEPAVRSADPLDGAANQYQPPQITSPKKVNLPLVAFSSLTQRIG